MTKIYHQIVDLLCSAEITAKKRAQKRWQDELLGAPVEPPKPKILSRPSPNHNSRPDGVEPSLIVIHGTVGTDQGDLSWLTTSRSRVSYHYLIWRDGTIYRLVPESRRAWHAGRSSWQGRGDCNDFSIGIGLSNKGNGELYTNEQYAACGRLCTAIMGRRNLLMGDIVGHYHISPGRKTDPWYHFEWMRLAEEIDSWV